MTITIDELEFLRKNCPYLDEAYFNYVKSFHFRPNEQVDLSFEELDGSEYGDVHITIQGRWVETILYEVPLLALTSEAYFKFCNTDWDYDGQEQGAYSKGKTLLEGGCLVSDFGSRRRRDYHTHDLVVKGLVRASKERDLKGKLTGTSNVHLAMKHGIAPVGTVAHEWYMGIAAITNNYEKANELGLRYWVGCFGEGVRPESRPFIEIAALTCDFKVLGIALTDTFGTSAFFKAFRKPIVPITTASRGAAATLPSAANETTAAHIESLADTKPPITAPYKGDQQEDKSQPRSYAEVFAGIRQDSGDPKYYVKEARIFYDSIGITGRKAIVFSDSLNVERCLEYKAVAEEAGFAPSFGVGTSFTNDFVHKSNGKRSVPLNIVIKLSRAGGRPAIKISDNIGKNTGDAKTVAEVKARLGYMEEDWEKGDEALRWGKEGD